MSLPSLCEQLEQAHLCRIRMDLERQQEIDEARRIREEAAKRVDDGKPRNGAEATLMLFAEHPRRKYTKRDIAKFLKTTEKRSGAMLDGFAADLRCSKYGGYDNGRRTPPKYGYRKPVISEGLGDHQNVTKLRTGRKGAAS